MLRDSVVGGKSTVFRPHQRALYIRHMSDVAPRVPVVAPAALHLSSLLDLSSRLSESDSADRILNAALLSVMGKLKIRRSCVLHPDGGHFFVSHAKGMTPPVVAMQPFSEMRFTSSDDDTAPLHAAGIHWLVPLVYQGELSAVLCFGPTLDGTEGVEDVQTYMGLVRAITTTALHNAHTVQSLLSTTVELEKRNLLVTTLFESARDFSGMNDLRTILRTLSYRLMGQLMISSFALYLREPVSGERVVINRAEAEHLIEVADAAHTIDHVCRVDDLERDHPARTLLLEAGVAAVAPMTVHGEVKGVLAVCGKLSGVGFSDEELTFIESLGNTAMAAIENDRLFEQEIERRRLQNELSIAADIQRGLLPLALPETPGMEIAASTIPSKHVSGDYYDVIALDDHRTLLAVADVSGKGIPASLLMANVQAALNVLASLDLPLTAIAERINRLVCDNTEPDVFVTMFLAIVDHDTHALQYVNMGHNPPFLLGANDVVLLSDGGVIAGVLPEPPPYRLGFGTFPDDGVLVLYTDGVTEARNDAQHEYGIGSLVEIVRAVHDRPAGEILEAIIDDVRRHAEGRPLDDDTSILIARRRGRPV